MHPRLSRNVPPALALVFWVLSLPVGAAKLPDVVVTGDPVAPSPAHPGTGLCAASSVSTDPASDFPQSASSFIGGMNDFMERTASSRVTSVLRTPFDLSNNQTTAPQTSRGDFVDAVPGCPSYGCGFFNNSPTTSFGSRFRGYLNVTPGQVNRPLHFGFFTDDAVSFVIFDRNNVLYQVINRPPQLGNSAWRTTNTVTFLKAGLYPVEVLYAEVAEHAALEMAILDGAFTDFERGANQTPIVKLNDSGFLLVSAERFFQTETGSPSFSDLDQCVQCNRANANAPGNGGCGLNSGRYCNGAALCAPCDTARVCGPSCSPCGTSTPFCVNANGTFTCVECTADSQCRSGRCDAATHTCLGCDDDTDCPGEEVCNLPTSTCVECNADGQCPNNEVCDLSTFTCVECTADNQCPNGRCDAATRTCLGCNAEGQCPNGKVCNLPTATCVECNAEGQCSNGKVCHLPTFTCVECNADSQCSNGRVCNLPTFTCVACNADSQCSTGKVCNLATFTCVECNADSQCPNGRCDLATSACQGCNDDADCPQTGRCDTTAHACTGCNDTTDCPNGRVCDVARSSCVECTRNEDCLLNQVCNPELKQCRQCTPADDCGSEEPDPSPPGGGCGCGASDVTGSAFLLMWLTGLWLLRSRRQEPRSTSSR